MKWGINMAVIRVQKTDNYSVISNEHLRNRDMSLKAKGLMTLMLSLPPTWDYSIGGLVAICKESHTSIRSAIKELEENRYLVRERKNNEKGYFVYEYTLYETRQPHTGNVNTVKGDADNTHTENRTQINKEKLKKEKIKKDNKNIDKYNINNYLDILNTIPDNQLRNFYCDFLDNRNRMGDPLTLKGFELLIERVRELAGLDVERQKELLKLAIINNWKSVYLPQQETKESGMAEDLKKFYE